MVTADEATDEVEANGTLPFYPTGDRDCQNPCPSAVPRPVVSHPVGNTAMRICSFGAAPHELNDVVRFTLLCSRLLTDRWLPPSRGCWPAAGLSGSLRGAHRPGGRAESGQLHRVPGPDMFGGRTQQAPSPPEKSQRALGRPPWAHGVEAPARRAERDHRKFRGSESSRRFPCPTTSRPVASANRPKSPPDRKHERRVRVHVERGDVGSGTRRGGGVTLRFGIRGPAAVTSAGASASNCLKFSVNIPAELARLRVVGLRVSPRLAGLQDLGGNVRTTLRDLHPEERVVAHRDLGERAI